MNRVSEGSYVGDPEEVVLKEGRVFKQGRGMISKSWAERYLIVGEKGFRYHKILLDHGNGVVVKDPTECGAIPADALHDAKAEAAPGKAPSGLPKGHGFTVTIPASEKSKKNVWTFYTPDYEAWIEVINSNSQSRRRGISQAGRDILEISMGINQGPAALAALSAADLAAALPPPPPPAEEGEGGEEKEERSTSTDKRKSKKRVGGLAALARAKTPNAKNAQGFETQPMTVAPAGAPSEPASDPPAQDAPPAFDDFMGD